MLEPYLQRIQNRHSGHIEGKKIVNSFLTSVLGQPKGVRILEITNGHMPVVEVNNATVKQEYKPEWKSEISKEKQFDFILGNLPFGLRPSDEAYVFGEVELGRIRQNWLDILDSLPLLSDGGLGVYTLEPNGFSLHNGARLEEALNLNGFYINAILNCPKEILKPLAGIQPILVLISKKKVDSVFVAELLDESQACSVATNFLSNITPEKLTQGLTIENRSFCGFKKIKTRIQAERVQTQFKEYKPITIQEIAEEINMVREERRFEEKENVVYIPKVGNSAVVTNIKRLTLKQHNYYQVVLSERALSEYIAIFYKSELGRLELESLKVGITIENITRSRLVEGIIPLPSIGEQKKIIFTQKKLEELKNEINTLENELALNPTNSSSALSRLDDMISVFKGLTDSDEVYKYIRQGESKTMEFKETLSLDVRKQTKEKYIETSVLKTIVAFLNTIGGVLLIGISDNGDILGVDAEIDKLHKGKSDKFLLHFKNLVKDKIGTELYESDIVDYTVIDVGSAKVLRVVCGKSNYPCYLENKDFYVRANPATDKLEGPELVEYVQHHFNQ